MNEWDTFWTGIAPDHIPALIVAALLPGLYWLHRALTPGRPQAPKLPLLDSVARVLLAITAAVHVGLPLGHRDNPVLTVGFIGSGIAFAWLALRVHQGKSWRLLTALLSAGTLIAYLFVITAGGEEPDQLGIVTALDELILVNLALTPSRARPRRFARGFATSSTIALTLITGVAVWAGAIRAHQASDLDASLPSEAGGTNALPAAHEHEHDHSARAQAGIIMRPLGEDHNATAEQVKAAADLAEATRKANVRFADLQAALDAGYKPAAALKGPDVHLENKAYAEDGRVLDPERPEALVYAVMDGKATLLGSVYRMPVAGRPGPAPGGPITRWHSHNVCFSILPPGLGVASPFGGCPAFSVGLTISEMMHVWTVDNPSGPYTEGLDAKWVKAFNAEHGRPWQQ